MFTEVSLSIATDLWSLTYSKRSAFLIANEMTTLAVPSPIVGIIIIPGFLIFRFQFHFFLFFFLTECYRNPVEMILEF